jgi:hypothetical protein
MSGADGTARAIIEAIERQKHDRPTGPPIGGGDRS